MRGSKINVLPYASPVQQVFFHLILNILGEHRDLPDKKLSRINNDDWRYEIQNQITTDVYKIMSILTYADLSSLDLTWFDEECQINLRVYFNRAPALVRYNIYETVTNLWEDIVEAESNNLAWPDWYELPSIRIHIGRTSRENELQNSKYMRLGKYHLGGLYPVENWKEYWVDRQKDDFEMEIFWYDCHHYPETILPTQKLAAKSIYPEEAATPQVTTGNIPHNVSLQIVFPDLKRITTELLGSLCDCTHRDIGHIPYRRIINAHGRENIVNKLYGYIDHSMKSLQDQKIDTQSLRSVINAQPRSFDAWLPDSGYADIVLDDRDQLYWRAYIGQASQPKRRIRDHIRGAVQRTPQTLHYYIVQKGQGFRSMNFIRLWTMDPSDNMELDKETHLVLINLLEMVFCRAFQSLPTPSLQKFFTPPGGQYSFSNLGLNVLSPLYQGITATMHVRRSYLIDVDASLDLEIRGWPAFRAITRKPEQLSTNQRQSWSPDRYMTRWQDYIDLFKATVRKAFGIQATVPFTSAETNVESPNGYSPNLSAWEVEFERELNSVSGTSFSTTSPRGNLCARIGIIINQTLVGDESDKETSLLPWGLAESGFNQTNSLIWFWDPRYHTLTHRRRLRSEINPVIEKYNRLLIQRSNLKVILVDWETINALVLNDHDYKRFALPLYYGDLNFVIETKEDIIKRVYIESPESLATLWAQSGHAATRLSEAFKFAAVLTETHGIRPYFCISQSAVHHILSIYQEEENGAKKMTISDTHPVLNPWLFRKGFRTQDDLLRLEKIGGSLAKSMMLLLCALRRRSNRPKKLCPLHTIKHPIKDDSAHRSKKQKHILDEDEMNGAENLYDELNFGSSGKVDSKAGDGSSEAATGDSQSIGYQALGVPDSQELIQIDELIQKTTGKILSNCSSSEAERLEQENNDDASLGLTVEILQQRSAACDPEQNLVCVARDGDPNCLQLEGSRPIPVRWAPSTHAKSAMANSGVDLRTVKQLLETGVVYSGTMQDRNSRLWVRMAPDIAAIILPLPAHASGHQILVRAHIHPGKSHPQKWATESRDGDSGAKLAISYKFDNVDETYIFCPGQDKARKANTFVDLASNDPIEALAIRPRRQFNAHHESICKWLDLPQKGTWYTDDEGNLEKVPLQ